MKLKKIFLIVVLIILLLIIGIVLITVNEKSVEIIENTSSKENSTKNKNEDNKPDNSDMIQITDNYFIQQTNDIYMNLDEYVGKTIKIEGIVYTYDDFEGKKLYAVVRNTPGCCGNDGLAGVDIRYDGIYPEKDTWVEVIGIISKENINGENMPVINVSVINEKEVGTSFVTN